MSGATNIAEGINAARQSGDLQPLMAAVPYFRWLGLRVERRGEELITLMPFQDMLIGNPMLPALHGGITGALLESAAMISLIGAMATPKLPKIINITIEYLRPGRAMDSYATGIVTKQGRRVANVRAYAWQRDRDKLITPVHYLFRPDDNHMLEHFKTVGRATKIPILIYNVIPWSYLSPALLIRIMKQVPQVVGVKQSAGDMKLLADLLLGAPPRARILSAVDALMYPSFALGAHGAVAAILTAAPAAQVRLWDLVQAGEHDAAQRLHERLLVLWNAMIDDNLPATVKFALSEQGVPGGYPRAPMPAASPRQQRAIARALKKLS